MSLSTEKMTETKVTCSKCFSYDSMYWEKNEDGQILCENCNESLIARNLVRELMQHNVKIDGLDEEEEDDKKKKIPEEAIVKVEVKKEEVVSEDEDNNNAPTMAPIADLGHLVKVKMEESEEEGEGPVVRRSIRATLSKYKHPDYEPPESFQKSRRRRFYHKGGIYKAPSATATCVTSPFVFNRGVYYQLGDIVALVDCEGRGVFYAQITAFMKDEYANKSATIQWLLPTQESPPHNIAFDPRTYYLGFIEEIPRSLDSMVPVMHAPCDYYRFNDTPYPPITPPPGLANYVWKNLDRIYIDVAPY